VLRTNSIFLDARSSPSGPLAKQETAPVAPDRPDTETEEEVPPFGAWAFGPV
ncbi:uncharacterized protein METZ01_LOCUS150833, partial [marine metagenome]